MRELSGRIDGKQVTINAVNPGFCYSDLHRHVKTGVIKIVLWLFGWTTQQGGHCLVDALVEHDDSHGMYLSEQKTTPYAFLLTPANWHC
jgi:hypothetical protein